MGLRNVHHAAAACATLTLLGGCGDSETGGSGKDGREHGVPGVMYDHVVVSRTRVGCRG